MVVAFETTKKEPGSTTQLALCILIFVLLLLLEVSAGLVQTD